MTTAAPPPPDEPPEPAAAASSSTFAEIGGSPVHFEEDWGAGIGGGLWSTGSAMAAYFRDHHDSARADLEGVRRARDATEAAAGGPRRPRGGIRALELGSGNGFLAACLAAAAGPDVLEELVVTDLADHLPLMRRTVDANAHLMERVDDRGGEAGEDGTPAGKTATTTEGGTKRGRVRTWVLEHRWGEFDDGVDGGGAASSSPPPVSSVEGRLRRGAPEFDFIFGSDLAYRDELHAPLIASIDRFAHRDTVALVGVTMNDTKPSFFEKLREAGFRYERLADWLMEPEFRGATFGLFAIRRDGAHTRRGRGGGV